MRLRITRSALRSISVRVQIMLGFGLILLLGLLIAAIGYANLRLLHDEADFALDTASRIRELSLQVKNEFLSARQSETAFLTEWRTIGVDAALAEHAKANEHHLAQVRAGLVELDELVKVSGDPTLQPLLQQTVALQPQLDAYEDAFQNTVQLTAQRSRAKGLEELLKDKLRQLEADVRRLSDTALLQLILQIRANEQAYFGTQQQQYVDNIRELATRFVDTVEASTPAELTADGTQLSAPTLVDAMVTYQDAFAQLAAQEDRLQISTIAFREATKEINVITNQIGLEGETILEVARQRLDNISRRSNAALTVTAIVALSSGSLGAYLLGLQITAPLRRLSQAAEQIRAGQLEQQVEVTGGHEFITLANSFNAMTSQLGQTLSRLEQLVADRTRALEATTKVSQSLSTILDPEQLVAEVVTQIQAAFDYYHTHIYLLDEAGEYLVMVGGTGEAGRLMLERGHSIPKGMGLVGRAAATNRVVLVPDVSQEAGWLPNPLLPNTCSEVAVPIATSERVLGVLDVQHDMTGGLTGEDARLLQSIARQVALALRNAHLYVETQRQAELERIINEINQKIIDTATVEQALQVAVREVGRALEGQRTSIRLETTWNSNGQKQVPEETIL